MNSRSKNVLTLCTLGLLLQLGVSSAADKSQLPPEVKQARPPISLPPEIIANLPGPAPTNVTLTAVSPTNITITWSAVPGAVRYLISHNGAPDITIEANAGYQQGNRFVYTELGRQPATLHTYTVTAQFPAPTRPGRSAAAQVLTPSPLAPQGFSATRTGPNAVTLRWNARPEASGYRVVRTGGGLQPATFGVAGLTYVDQNLPVGQYHYAVYSVVRLASGEEFSGEASIPITVKTRPFNMVAIGDSIMWGQGLRPQNKFATKVSQWIGGQLGKPVDLRWRAHSGAITYPNPGPTYENFSYDGEVPSDWPTISHQVALASSPSVPNQPPASDVDLVLIDGCANNVGILTVLDPTGHDENLRSQAKDYCGAGMTNVLTEVVQKFPNADVIVTGYFLYVSDSSNLGELVPVFSVIVPEPILATTMTAAFRARAAARSRIFFYESNSSLQAAVNTVNSMQIAGRTRFNQIRFAPLAEAPDKSYAASANTWQWLIPRPPLVQDEVYNTRKQRCDEILIAGASNSKPDVGAHAKCLEASMGHPNVAGSQAYTDAITAVAAQLLPAWRTAHVGPTLAPEDSMIVKAQPSGIDAYGGTIVITASNGPSAPALQGTVQLNGVPAGALGAPIRYEYQQHDPTDIFGRVDVPGRQSRYFAIPVRKFSVEVNVTNNGDPRTALVVATDTVTGQPLGGTVTLNTSNRVTGQTGQALTYPSCGPAMPVYRLTSAPPPAPVPCSGTVHVPFYGGVAFQDFPGATATFSIQQPARPIRSP